MYKKFRDKEDGVIKVVLRPGRYVFLLLKPPGLFRIGADFRCRHRRAAVYVGVAAFLNSDVGDIWKSRTTLNGGQIHPYTIHTDAIWMVKHDS